MQVYAGIDESDPLGGSLEITSNPTGIKESKLACWRYPVVKVLLKENKRIMSGRVLEKFVSKVSLPGQRLVFSPMFAFRYFRSGALWRGPQSQES